MPPQDPSIAGAQPVVISPGGKNTYVAVAAAFTPYATPTDIITLPGNVNTIARLRRMLISNIQTTAGLNIWRVIKRAAANTGGTSANLTAVPVDSVYPAAQSIPKKWTAAPTINSTVGSVLEKYVEAPALASVFSGDSVLYDFSPVIQAVTLRGVAEEIALNFNSVAVPAGLSIIITLEWSEE